MSGPTAFLGAFAHALAGMTLYAAGHPARERAIDDAMFWTALCQFEQGQFKMAAGTLATYRKKTDQGNWARESRYLLALSQAATGDYPSAIKELEAVDRDDPEYAGYRLLIRQWQAQQGTP